jgi:uncharacterized protein YodC (DUF2158 family)
MLGMDEIKVGDIVHLKSQRLPKMTVKWIQQQDYGKNAWEANCDWFDNKSNKFYNQTFPFTSLDKD